MRKMYLFLLLIFAGVSGTRAQELLRLSIYFETDQYALTTAARQSLDGLLQQTVDLTDFHVQILAFTDDRGTEDYNYQLASRRGEAVQSYLQALGLLVEKTTVQSLGEIQLEEPDEEGRARNRRVDLVLTTKLINSLSELWQDLGRDHLQEFSIEPGKGNMIQGKGGTKVWLPPNALTFTDGTQPKTPVRLLLKESYAYSEMIIDGLSTQSDGQLLETGGMVYLEAEAEGRSLQLASGQQLTIGMPTAQLQEGMQLFMGERGVDGSVNNWTPTQQAPAPTMQDILNDLPPKPAISRHWIHPPKQRIDDSNEPQAPQKPVRPHEPFKPRRESIVYHPGALAGIFMTKAKRKQKEEALYASRMEEYEQKMDKYRERKVKYDGALEAYTAALQTYKLAHQEWDRKQQEQKENFKSTPAYQTYLLAKKKSAEARRAVYEQQMDEWFALKLQIIAEYEAKYGKIVGAGNVARQYVYQVNRMGWINCDRFYDVSPEEKVDLAIEDVDEEQAELFVIFKDIRNIMKARKVSGKSQYQVKNLPRDMDIRVVGVKIIDGKPQLAIRDTKVSDQSPLRLQYQAANLQKIRTALKDLDT